MQKTGFLWLGHTDYLGADTAALQQQAAADAAALPLMQAETGPIATTDAQAIQAVRVLVEEKQLCGVVLVLTSWVECSVVMTALKELRGRPCMLWGCPAQGAQGGTGSYVSAAMFSGVIQRLKLPCPILIAEPGSEKARRTLAAFSVAAAAMDMLFYAKIGLFGYTSMSIYTGTFDHVLMRHKIGPEIDQMDTYSLIRAAESAAPAEIEQALARLGTLAHIRPDAAPEQLRRTMALYAALRRFCAEKGWSAVNVKCQYELSKEYKTVPCVALSLLAEDGITASCEGDILCTVSMLLLSRLAQSTAWYGDTLTHWANTVQFSPCGFLPFSLAQGTAYVQKFMEHPGFSGIQVSGVLRPEKVTFLRLVEDVGTYHLLYGTGTGTQTAPRGGCMPALNVELDGCIDALCAAYAGQHFALVYGDWSAEIELFAALSGLDPLRV